MAEQQQWKLSRIIKSHEQVKISFHQLKYQIKFGLHEAEDVFQSLSLPLMKLVGLKTEEMAREGRFSTIVTDSSDSSLTADCRMNGFTSMPARSSCSVNGGDRIHSDHQLEDVSHATNAIRVSKIFREKQELQLKQLVHLLRQIEIQVNNSQCHIMENLEFHRVSLNRLFRKAASHITNLNQRNHNQDAFNITLKLLQVIFEQVSTAFGAVENGVDGLIRGLSDQMFCPMVKYVKCLKADMENGTCQHLLSVVEEMGVIMRDGRYELDEARRKWRAAEEQKIEALSRLIDSEEKMKIMNKYLGSLLKTKENSANPVVRHQEDEEEETNEKLKWELMKKRRKRRMPESPFGGEGILHNAEHNKKASISPTTGNISRTHGPITRSCTSSQRSTLKPPCFKLPLGYSPSVNLNHQPRSVNRSAQGFGFGAEKIEKQDMKGYCGKYAPSEPPPQAP